ncbi:13E12 repeat family protein, partial [Phycicoccus flavus]
MDRGDVSSRIAALRGDAVLLARDLAEHGRSLDPTEAFEVAGELQAVVNAVEGAQAVTAAYGARVEYRLTSDALLERVHAAGFVDGMAPSMLSMEAGVTEGVAGRKLRLGARLSEAFPAVRDLVLEGEVAAVTAHKVLDACAGLDLDACGRVDARLAPRLAGMDPARVSSETRRIAARVAADQVAEHAAKTKKVRTVEVCPSEDGLTEWFALLPTATSKAAWSAVESLAAEYRDVDDTLTVPESRADAFGDLLLRNVSVSAQVTLGVPVVTGVPDSAPVPTVRTFSPRDPDETIIDATTGEEVRIGDLPADTQEDLGWHDFADYDTADGPGVPTALEMAPTRLGSDTRATALVSGVQLPGLGWVDATTVAGILTSLPLQVARAVLDADTGTLASITSDAYRPPARMRQLVTTRDGTCRMYGCSRPA